MRRSRSSQIIYLVTLLEERLLPQPLHQKMARVTVRRARRGKRGKRRRRSENNGVSVRGT